MKTEQIVNELKEMARSRLFGETEPWPISVEETRDLKERFVAMVFLGIYDWCEHPHILQSKKLLNEAEFEIVCDQLDEAQKTKADPWTVLRPVVKRAFLNFVEHDVRR